MKNNIIPNDYKFNDRCHTTRSWPESVETRNNSKETEEFNESMLPQLFEYDENYKLDYLSSIDFITNLNIPNDREVHLTNSKGCLICHSDLINDSLHYPMIKGLCDLKTIQYYLFSRGIWFRVWYIKAHLKHINIKTIKTNEVKVIESDAKIIENQMMQINSELERYNNLGGIENDKTVLTLRKQLLDLLQLKSNLDVNSETKNNMMNFNDFMNKIKSNKSSENVINIDSENPKDIPKDL